jgi:hypothetical protein
MCSIVSIKFPLCVLWLGLENFMKCVGSLTPHARFRVFMVELF